jgi:hypothetical protein
MFDLTVVVACAAAVMWRPRLLPYLVVFGTVFQSTLTRTLTSDGDVLLGCVIGILAIRVREQGFRRPVVTPALAAFALFNAAVLAALAGNLFTGRGHEVMQSSEYFVLRSVLVALAVLLTAGQSRRDWIRAVAAAAFALASLRLLQIAHVPTREAAARAGISLLGDFDDPGSWNVFATLLAVGIGFQLSQLDRARGWIWAAGLGAGVVTTVGMATATSRTAAIVLAIVLLVIFMAASAPASRLAILLITSAFIVVSLTPVAALAGKPVIVQTTTPKSEVAQVDAPPLVVPPAPGSSGYQVPGPTATPIPPPAIKPDWRSVLDRDYYRLRQEIHNPAWRSGSNHLLFVARSTSTAHDVDLHVAINNDEVAVLPAEQAGRWFRWFVVGIPERDTGGDVVDVNFWITGHPNSSENFFLVGGLYANADGYQPGLAVAGGPYRTDDVSADPGRQYGVLMAFVNEVPAIRYFRAPPASGNLDPSISDRLALWTTALQIFAAHPLFGTGFYTFGDVRQQYEKTPLFFAYANAHSNYLELLSDTGLVGVLAFAALLLLPALTAFRGLWGASDRAVRAALAAGMIGLAVSSLTQTWIADSRLYISAWSLALVAGLAARRTGTGQTS